MPHIQLYFDDNIIVCGGAIHKVSLQSTVIGLEYCSSKVNNICMFIHTKGNAMCASMYIRGLRLTYQCVWPMRGRADRI